MTIAEVEAREEHDTLDGIPSPAATYRLHGHERPWAELVAAEKSGRLHHAWLLQGPRGIGKATAAFAFARHLLSRGTSGVSEESEVEPASSLARQVAGGSHPSLVHIARAPADRGGFKTQVTVEDIRKLNRFFHTTASGGQWRIAVIDPADDMNRSAANALLKILEEPPERSIFLITNHLPGRLLPTIRSRCRVLRFDALAPTAMADTLRAMPIPLTGPEVEGAIALSGGSVRTAVTLLASDGLEVEAHLGRIFAEREPDWQAIHALIDALTQKGRETAFDLMVAAAFKRLAEEADARSVAGDAATANRLAALWMEEGGRLREGLAFNLDRKQLMLTFFHRLFARRAFPDAA